MWGYYFFNRRGIMKKVLLVDGMVLLFCVFYVISVYG